MLFCVDQPNLSGLNHPSWQFMSGDGCTTHLVRFNQVDSLNAGEREKKFFGSVDVSSSYVSWRYSNRWVWWRGNRSTSPALSLGISALKYFPYTAVFSISRAGLIKVEQCLGNRKKKLPPLKIEPAAHEMQINPNLHRSYLYIIRCPARKQWHKHY